ncbi:MAG: MraY family glycosyltransferase [Candidatus Buchananbacteria bacterium]
MNSFWIYLISLGGGFVLTAIITPFVILFAKRFNITDNPSSADRKIHQKITPLLGGVSIFIASFIILFIIYSLNVVNFSRIPQSVIWGVFIGAILIMIGGFLDDKYNLKPYQQIVWPVLASIIVLISGVNITYITNPVGIPGTIFYLPVAVGAVISFIWLMGMMYTAKFLDGLDGLLSGISAIAALTIFFVSQIWDVPMSATGIWGLIIFGCLLGFLIFNWNPAKVFLGEGGSVYLGFILGVLSIISGSKIITTLLVMGIPILDVLWVIIQRLLKGESPFSHADRKHIHYRLVDFGFSKVGAVLFLYLLSLIFALFAMATSGFTKIIDLLIMLMVMVAIIVLIYIKAQKNEQRQKN